MKIKLDDLHQILKISEACENDSQQQKLAQALSTKLGREVKMTSKVDKSILGGVVIRSNDLVIDGSVRARLAKLAEAMNS